MPVKLNFVANKGYLGLMNLLSLVAVVVETV